MGPFFREMGHALRARGHASQRIIFNGGDRFFCFKEKSILFNGTLEEWPAFLKRQAQSLRVTDVVMYGDCRPFHRLAIETLKPMGITLHVLEEGYLRPSWVTCERDGVNAFSPFAARLPALLEEPAPAALPAFAVKERAMLTLGAFASMYYVACLLDRHRFPHYCHHFSGCIHRAMLQWLPRLSTLPLRRAEAYLKRKWLKRHPYYLVPLQLERDYQVIEHSPFTDMRHFIATVMESFARQPRAAKLVFKNHPLDNGLTSLRRIVREEARKYGISHQVCFMDAGRLPPLLKHAQGVVTINSTAGLSALHHDKPTIALGRAIYQQQGITFSGKLDDFWTQAQPPMAGRYAKLRQLLIAHTQLPGGFYTKAGRAHLLPLAVARLLQEDRPQTDIVEFKEPATLLDEMYMGTQRHSVLLLAALNIC